MKTGLILTIGSLGFIVLLIVAYYSQQIFSRICSKMYRGLLVIVILFLSMEIISTVYFVNEGSMLITNILLRIKWLIEILWFLGLYMYNVCFLTDVKVTTIKELITTNKKCSNMIIFTIICIIIYLFLPFPKMTYETYSYLSGIPVYFIIFFYCFIIDIAINVLMLKRRKDISKHSKNAVRIMNFEKIIIIVLQILFPRTAMLGLGAVLQIYFLYFYVENPDILMISSLEDLKKDIERANMAKTDFLSNMSHEIRSPMNAVVGFSETILNNPQFNPETTKADIEHIVNAGHNLLDIINNILDISKIESGSENLDEKDYSIGSIVMELSSIIEARLVNRPIKFITEVDKDIPKKVYGDSTKLFQVLLNVLTNSMKYTEVGRIRLTVTSKKDVKNNKVTLNFKVSDTGYGIKQEDFEKLFEKFSRLSSATVNEIEGTGLGLVITKKYVDLLGGKIWFESDYGVGTTFYVEVTQPIVDATPIGDIRENNNNTESLEYVDCTGKRVLVVDDNSLNLKVAKKILSKYNFTIDTANSGKECIYKIKKGEKYDMIFIDHMMPEMDGIEAIHILRKLEGYTIPPVIALTANAITGVRNMYLKEGFDEYLSKPINLTEMNRIINMYFVNK